MVVARQLIAFGRLKRPPLPRALLSALRRKTTNRLRAIETTSRSWEPLRNGSSRKTTNRLRAIETKATSSNAVRAKSRKTTNRLRAIETGGTVLRLEVKAQVARQLIAFGRLKRTVLRLEVKAQVVVARQLIAFGRLKRVLLPEVGPSVKQSQDN